MSGFVVHWDGKILPDLVGISKVDRLSVVITRGEFQLLLGVLRIPSGSGKDIATAVFNLLDKWGLLHRIMVVCFDITSANTGRFNGAGIIFEQLIGRILLYLPCRHHIYEIIFRDVFEVKMNSPTNSPNVPLFEQFKKKRPVIFVSKVEKNIVSIVSFSKISKSHVNLNFNMFLKCRMSFSLYTILTGWRHFRE